jgi:aarF domain-containing kinase
MISQPPVNNDELDAIRNAMVEREGLIASIFSLLRNAPRYVHLHSGPKFAEKLNMRSLRRRLVMILKLNDLQRALDLSLATTHGAVRTPRLSGQIYIRV